MKKSLRLLAVALLLTTIFVPLTAFADGDPGPNGGWPQGESSIVR